MAVQLREYQEKALADVAAEWKNGHRRVCVALGTGAGKTRLASEAARRAVERGKRVLWLAHRTELVDQARSTLQDHIQIPVGRIQADKKNPAPHSPVQVASVHTLIKRDVLPPADLVVVDECHHFVASEFRRITDAYGDKFHLLLSATPERADGRPLSGIADAIVAPVQPRELIAAGFLVPCEIVAPPFDMEKGLCWEPVDAWMAWAKGRRTVVFCANKAHAAGLAAQFRARGIKADSVCAETPWEKRKLIYQRLASGDLRVMTNVFVATEGLDIPEVEVVMIARTVGHAGMYLQCTGRALRPATAKGSALLIDLRGAVHKFGPPDANRTYSLDGDEGVTTEEDEAHRKQLTCAQCGAVRTGVMCPVCSATAALGASEPEIVSVPLQEVSTIPRSPAHFAQYVRWLVAEFKAKGQPASGAPGRAAERFWQAYRAYPDATWVTLFRKWVQGDTTRPDGWPEEVTSPSMLYSLQHLGAVVTSCVVTDSVGSVRCAVARFCRRAVPCSFPTALPPRVPGARGPQNIMSQVASSLRTLPEQSTDGDRRSPKDEGRSTSFATLTVRLWDETFDRVVDLVYDPTIRLHDLQVALAKKRINLREVMNASTSDDHFASAKHAYDATTFQLAAIRQEVLRRDQGRGRAEQRWAREFVAEAARVLPPELLARLEAVASEAVDMGFTAAEVRP